MTPAERFAYQAAARELRERRNELRLEADELAGTDAASRLQTEHLRLAADQLDRGGKHLLGLVLRDVVREARKPRRRRG